MCREGIKRVFLLFLWPLLSYFVLYFGPIFRLKRQFLVHLRTIFGCFMSISGIFGLFLAYFSLFIVSFGLFLSWLVGCSEISDIGLIWMLIKPICLYGIQGTCAIGRVPSNLPIFLCLCTMYMQFHVFMNPWFCGSMNKESWKHHHHIIIW